MLLFAEILAIFKIITVLNFQFKKIFFFFLINISFTNLLIKTKILLFLTKVIGYNNYYIIYNSDLLVCGNKSIKAFNFNRFVGDNGVKKHIEIYKSGCSLF